MGAGDFAAGLGPAGFDPIESSTAVPAEAAAALKYDASRKDFVQDDDGRLEAVHPIDQQVALSVHLVQGTVSAVPSAGNTKRKVDSIGGKGFEADIRDRILTSNPLARLITNGDVTVAAVLVETGEHGRLLAALEYFNNRLDPTKKVRAEALL